ncbi:MAG: hypothetical protein RI911_154 [Candidatus Parcubacteria bacterium]|jgi:hypothetical protein
MNYKTIAYTIIGLIVAVLASGFAYFYTMVGMQTQQAIEPGEIVNVQIPNGKRDPLKIARPFYIEGATEAYTDINQRVTDVILSGIRENGAPQETSLVPLYKELFAFYDAHLGSEKEQAYLLNMANLLFNHGYNAKAFEEGVSESEAFGPIYKKHQAKLFTYKSKQSNIRGIMFDSTAPGLTYAAQKTIADMNDASYKLYPGAYSLLRKNLNTLQAESLLHQNYNTGKKYDPARWDQPLLGYFGPTHLDDLMNQMKPYFDGSAKLYEGAYGASFELHVMYATGVLWPKYQSIRADESKKAETERLLRDVVYHSNEMLKKTDEYNTGSLTYGYAIAAFLKSRVAFQEILPEADAKQIDAEALRIMETLIEGQGANKEFRYWIASLPQNGWMSRQVRLMGTKSPKVQTFLDGLK